MDAASWVLARCGEEGIAEAMIPALARCDPFLRGGIRRRVRAIIDETSKATTVTDEAHVMRLAFLRAARRAAPPDDVNAVLEAFTAAKVAYSKKKSPFWTATFSVLCVIAVIGVGAVVFVIMPSRRDRFADSAVGKAFGEGLTDYVAGVSHRDADRIEKGKALILSKGVKSQAGQAAYDQLDESLSRTLKISQALTPEEADSERERLDAALRALDAQLKNKKVPAFLDEHTESGFDGARVWLMGDYAEQRADLVIAGDTTAIAWGRRLDTLNLDVGGTVYRSSALQTVIVALDEVEQFVAAHLVPGLGKNRALPTSSEPAPELSARGRAERKAGEKVRAELLAGVGWTEDDGTEVGDLFVQRHDAFERLRLLGDDMFEPRGVRMSDRLRRALAKRDKEVDAKEILRIDERLQRGAIVKGFDALVAVQASIHEVDFVYAAFSSRRSATASLADVKEAAGRDKLDARASMDLAGILASIAASDKPVTALCVLAQRSRSLTPNVALYEIERELGSAPTWLKNGYMNDDEDWSRGFEDAVQRPPAELKRAASTVWAKVFGEPFPAYERKPR